MTNKLFDLTGKTALVTGASHGLGMEIAIGLAEAGAKVVFNNHNAEKKIEAEKAYEKAGFDIKGYLFDVTKEAEVIENIQKIEKEVGPIDILVNNAAIIKRIPILDMKVEEFREVMDIDLVAAFIVSKHVVKGMIERRHGKIINICSMMSELGRDTVAAYAAAKGGLKMLTKSMATEWAKYNIQVNAIGPGYFATSQTASLQATGNPFNDFIISRTPAGKWGDPAQLKGPAVFLASEASDFVNGHVLYVDGGILATIGKPVNT
ncbi:MAG TPA: gluconate 5-dehydrogenase [Bacteroidales bacterium]|nr:gluconate 5-dehydrogenase [Bacteroidales bacterium]